MERPWTRIENPNFNQAFEFHDFFFRLVDSFQGLIESEYGGHKI